MKPESLDAVDSPSRSESGNDRTSNFKRLGCAVIHRAVQDFRALEANGNVTGSLHEAAPLGSRERVKNMNAQHEIRDLIYFFTSGGFDLMVTAVGMHPDRIRRKLGIPKGCAGEIRTTAATVCAVAAVSLSACQPQPFMGQDLDKPCGREFFLNQ